MRALLPWLAVARAVDLHVATTAEGKHLRPFWSIGEGFEGSASDWVEYVVWLLGVIGVFYYMMNPNMRRNLHAVDDEHTAYGYVRHNAKAEAAAEAEAEADKKKD